MNYNPSISLIDSFLYSGLINEVRAESYYTCIRRHGLLIPNRLLYSKKLPRTFLLLRRNMPLHLMWGWNNNNNRFYMAAHIYNKSYFD